MKKIFLLPFMALIFSATAEDFPNQEKGTKKSTLAVEKADYTGWELVWGDEFNYTGTPDPKKWNYETGFVRNKEAQWYQAQNATCKDGCLIITGKKQTVENPNYEKDSPSWQKNRSHAYYTSASLTTKKKFAWKYGRFEAKAKFSPESGMWPAFWTIGIADPWPNCGEIDIMEYYKETYLANLCWGSTQKGQGNWSTTKTPLSYFKKIDPAWGDKFHVFRMDWDEKYISLFVDDILLNRTEITNIKNDLPKNVKQPFHQPHIIILNLALGATGGNLENVTWPQEYQVDYVRIYQKKDSKDKGTIELEKK